MSEQKLIPFSPPETIPVGTTWSVPLDWRVSVYTKSNRRLVHLVAGSEFVFVTEGENRLFVIDDKGIESTHRVLVEE
jgi:hypothetical protein